MIDSLECVILARIIELYDLYNPDFTNYAVNVVGLFQLRLYMLDL